MTMMVRKTSMAMMRKMMMMTITMITLMMIMKKGCVQLDFARADEKNICSMIFAELDQS